MAQWLARSLHHGRRAGKRSIAVASRRAVPARRQSAPAARSGIGRRAHEQAARDARLGIERRAPMKTAGLSTHYPMVAHQVDARDAVEACVGHGIRAVDAWRDQVAAIGLDESARVIKANGMRVTGYCRGGMFPAVDRAGRLAAIDDNMRAIDEATALGAECLIL